MCTLEAHLSPSWHRDISHKSCQARGANSGVCYKTSCVSGRLVRLYDFLWCIPKYLSYLLPKFEDLFRTVTVTADYCTLKNWQFSYVGYLLPNVTRCCQVWPINLSWVWLTIAMCFKCDNVRLQAEIDRKRQFRPKEGNFGQHNSFGT